MAACAVLAACDMASQRCGPAALDGAHRLHLSKADMAGIGRTPCGPVVAEDIRDLQRWSSHGPLCGLGFPPSFGRLPRFSQPIERALHGCNHAGGDARIAGCRAQFVVSEQCLDKPNVRSGFKQVGGKAMT
jgi:hypothetical protein